MTATPAVRLADVLAALGRVRHSTLVTPVFPSRSLSDRTGMEVVVKAENLQRTGSFKVRGATNALALMDEETRKRGVAAASAGNHAQGVALAAAELGIRATIFMPEDASLPKVEATRGYGAEVVLTGATFEEAVAACARFCEETGAALVSAFDDPAVVAGQGTLALELLEQVPEMVTVVVPSGGGGLLAGVTAVLAEARPHVQVIGVQAEACPSLVDSLARGEPVEVAHAPTLADGIAVRRPGAVPLSILAAAGVSVVTVTEEDISRAVVFLLERARLLVEPAGAVGVAALLAGVVARPAASGPVVAVLSGGNIDLLLLDHLIAHGLAAAGRIVSGTVVLPDRPGELASLLAEVAATGANVLEVEHHRSGMQALGTTEIRLELETRGPEHADALRKLLAARSLRKG